MSFAIVWTLFRRLKTEEGVLPDLIVIDGGKGQVSQALSVLKELQIDDVVVIGVAKGASRTPGLEKLVLYDGRREHRLAADSGALHLLQHVRDEAHRFAVGAHRSSRAKSRNRSPLEDIAGIGAKRRQRLMQHFGGLQGVSRAGVDDLDQYVNYASVCTALVRMASDASVYCTANDHHVFLL